MGIRRGGMWDEVDRRPLKGERRKELSPARVAKRG